MINRSPFCIAVALAAISLPTFATAQSYRDVVLADNPLHYWTFDEEEGNAIDQVNSFTENELMPEGFAGRVLSTINAGGLSLGMAADFDGSNGTRFYAADLFGEQTTNSWAVEFWVRVLDPFIDSYITEATLNGEPNRSSIIHGYNDGELELFAGSAGRSKDLGSEFNVGGVTNLADGEWHHVVIGNDTDTLQHTFIIDNGEPIVLGLVNDFLGLEQLAIGNTVANGGQNGLFGQIDEYAIYDFPGVDGADFQEAIKNIALHYNAIPEPGTTSLLAIGGLLALNRRKRRSQG